MSIANRSKYLFVAFLIVLAVFGAYRLYKVFLINDYRGSGTEVESKPMVFQTREEFGRALFFDKRLSLDNTISCASCHVPRKAFTDGQVKSIGVGGKTAFRNASTLLNVKDAPVFMFDAHIQSLEEQAIVPIQDSNEMNIAMGDLIRRLQGIGHYAEASKQLYQREMDAWVLTRALAAFQRTLVSDNSPFDRYMSGDSEAISGEAESGWKLFNDLQCIECHSFPHFTNYQARNNGLHLDFGDDPGKFRIAGDSSLMGAFKVPSLRNVALTAPYMHDGSMFSLNDVIRHYNDGGTGHWNQDLRVKKRDLSELEMNYLINFLETLTDTSYMKDFR